MKQFLAHMIKAKKLFFSKFKQNMKSFSKWGFWAIIFCLGGIFVIDFSVSYIVKDRIYTDVKSLPYRQYALVLGTAKFYTSGQPNLFYKSRLDAAMEVFRERKAEYFLLSGDNTTPYYNEPRMMLQDLKRRGIPQVMLKQDFAGYDTLASIIRAEKTFHLPPFIIISQQFHCERALMIAKFNQIDAICYIAKYPDNHYQVRLREIFARISMLLDYLMQRNPDVLNIVEERTL